MTYKPFKYEVAGIIDRAECRVKFKYKNAAFNFFKQMSEGELYYLDDKGFVIKTLKRENFTSTGGETDETHKESKETS